MGAPLWGAPMGALGGLLGPGKAGQGVLQLCPLHGSTPKGVHCLVAEHFPGFESHRAPQKPAVVSPHGQGSPRSLGVEEMSTSCFPL